MGNGIIHPIGLELTLDGVSRSAGAIALRIAALDDKSRLDAVEGQAVIKTVLHQLHKVFHCDGGLLVVQLNVDLLPVFHGNGCLVHRILSFVLLLIFLFLLAAPRRQNHSGGTQSQQSFLPLAFFHCDSFLPFCLDLSTLPPASSGTAAAVLPAPAAARDTEGRCPSASPAPPGTTDTVCTICCPPAAHTMGCEEWPSG